MNDTNWELLKFKYEVLGVSIATLAQENAVSLPVLEFNSQNWNQIPLAKQTQLDLKDVTSLEDILTKLGTETASQTKAFAILKQKFLGPKYVELETVLLHKAIDIASNLNSDDPRSAATLRSLATVLGDLLDQNPLLTPGDRVDEEEGDVKEWRLTIVDAPTQKKEKKDAES